MQVVFHKIPIDNSGNSQRVITKAAVFTEIDTISHAWYGDVSVVS